MFVINRLKLNGKSDGGLDIVRGVIAGLETQLKKVTSDGDKESDLSIEYYATDLPDKNPTNVEDLVNPNIVRFSLSFQLKSLSL